MRKSRKPNQRPQLPRAGELVSTVRGRRNDRLLHEFILADGEANAPMTGVKYAKKAGLTEGQIAALYDPRNHQPNKR